MVELALDPLTDPLGGAQIVEILAVHILQHTPVSPHDLDVIFELWENVAIESEDDLLAGVSAELVDHKAPFYQDGGNRSKKHSIPSGAADFS